MTAGSSPTVRTFQSTPLMRGETGNEFGRNGYITFQSTPLMRGETKEPQGQGEQPVYFNPLPSCEGRRLIWPPPLLIPLNFNPLPSCEGRRSVALAVELFLLISIHSPHARGDLYSLSSLSRCVISIHSPHARGDRVLRHALASTRISIHSPHARGDAFCSTSALYSLNFNPLPSCEGRHTLPLRRGAHPWYFNPLPSCEGRPSES